MRASIASSFEVDSISTMRAELSGIEKDTVSEGNVREGANFTGNSGIKAIPIKAILKNATITVKADMEFFEDILYLFSVDLINL